jgi:hypothetical protein
VRTSDVDLTRVLQIHVEAHRGSTVDDPGGAAGGRLPLQRGESATLLGNIGREDFDTTIFRLAEAPKERAEPLPGGLVRGPARQQQERGIREPQKKLPHDLLAKESGGAREQDALGGAAGGHDPHRAAISSSLAQKSGRESRQRAEGSE